MIWARVAWRKWGGLVSDTTCKVLAKELYCKAGFLSGFIYYSDYKNWGSVARVLEQWGICNKVVVVLCLLILWIPSQSLVVA